MTRSVRRPPPLRPGDRVRVVAPGSPADRGRLQRGARALAALGYDVRVDPQARARAGHLAGDDDARAHALLAALGDPSVRAVFFARGGYGTTRLLPKVAPALGRMAPKILVGYSDATALLAWLTSRLGWVTFHGPMVASDLPELRTPDARSLVRTLRGDPPPPLRVRSVLHPGIGEGRLVGGCLSVVAALLGTPYAPDLRGAVLFLEDVAEPPYRLDRMLTQLLQSGALSGVRGVVFGEMARCEAPHAVKRVLAERTAALGVPVLFGAPSGHGRGKRTLPFGIRVRVDGRRQSVEFLDRCAAT